MVSVRPRMLVPALAGASVVAAGLLVPATAQPPRLHFSRPVTAIPAPLGNGQANTGEPRLVALPSGRLLLTAQFEQWNCATKQPDSHLSMCVWASDDGGRSFHVSGGDTEAGDDADFANAPGGAVLQLAMSDPAIGPVNLGTGIGGTDVFRSSDGGRTWAKTQLTNKTVLNDRPFFVTTPTAVLISFTAIPGDIQVIRSTDDGRTWSLPIEVSPQPDSDAVEGNGGPAYDATDRALLLPYDSSTDPSCTSGPAGCLNVLWVAISHDDGTSWSTQRVAQLPSGSGLTSMPQITVDGRGNRYLTYCATTGGHYDVYLARSTKNGRWSTPRAINGQWSAMVPWAVATGNGHVDVAYYRSAAADAGKSTRTWDFVVSDSRDGGRTWTTTVVGSGAYVGSGDNHAASVWDLEAIAYDRSGNLVVAWSDDRNAVGSPTVIRFARSIG